jgi:hypothetical protein
MVPGGRMITCVYLVPVLNGCWVVEWLQEEVVERLVVV